MNNNAKAVTLIGLSTLTFSTVPVVLAHAPGLNPLALGAVWRSGLCMGLTPYLAATHRQHFTKPGNARKILTRAWSPHLAMTTIGQADYALLTTAALTINMAVASTVFNLYTALAVCLTAALFRKSGRYRPITPAAMLLLGTAVLGTAVALAAEEGQLTIAREGSNVSTLSLIAVISAPFLSAMAAGSLRWGADTAQALGPDTPELPLALLATTIASATLAPIQLALAPLVPGTWTPPPQQFALVAAGGMTLNRCKEG